MNNKPAPIQRRNPEDCPLVTNQDYMKLKAERDALRDKVKRLELTIEYFTKPEGAFSRDRLEHAHNCIDNIKRTSERALKGDWCTYVKAALSDEDA